jgi:hypothetical protein
MIPFIPFLIVTSLYEVFVEGMEYNDTFHTFSHYDFTDRKCLLGGWGTMTLFITLLVVTSLTEVFIEGTEYDDTFHTCSHCDLIV